MQFTEGQLEHDVFGVRAEMAGQAAIVLETLRCRPDGQDVRIRLHRRKRPGERHPLVRKVSYPFRVTVDYLKPGFERVESQDNGYPTFSRALRAYADQLDWWNKH